MHRFKFSRINVSILIGNALDHFDTALYGFLAPILAPLFFPNHDPVVQLILAYSILGTSVVTHPLGAFLFGHVARSRGPAVGLSFSLIGVALMTVLIGCLPTYNKVGYWAPASLIIVRMMLGIFAAGESAIAKLYILEEKPTKHAYHTSSYLETSSVAGLILASCAVTAVASTYTPESYWRIPFFFGAMTAGVGFSLRRSLRRIPAAATGGVFQETLFGSMGLLWREKITLLRIAAVTSLSYVTYAIPFVFMNSFIPLITAVSFHEMIALNTFLLGFDMVAIPVIGRLTNRYQPQSMLIASASILGLSSLALFWFLPKASFVYVSFVRIWIVVFGVMYLCPLNIWLMKLVRGPEKYLLIGIGGSIGASVVGRNTTALALLLWHTTGYAFAPGCYILLAASLALWGIGSANVSERHGERSAAIQ